MSGYFFGINTVIYSVIILGSGIFTENTNVGSAKNVNVALSLSGIDGGNYVLSTNDYSVASGKILMLANANALGGGSVLSNNGLLGLGLDVTLSSLAVNGPVTLITNIRTLGHQRYGGAVTFASGSADSPMQIDSISGDIQFLGSLNSDVANRFLTLSSPAGKISFSDMVGTLPLALGQKAPLFTICM